MINKILLLGSGELGKELVISAKRLGQYVIACDSYKNAPAMQVADQYEVINMLDGNELDKVVEKHKPDFIVPEIEAIRTEKLFEYEKKGIKVVPSANAVNYTMNRKAIRDLASKECGLKTARYYYAKTIEELREAISKLGYPVVVKPLMSSSGKGQSFVYREDEIEKAFNYGISGSRGDIKELIVEEFINFDFEITLLTVTQRNGKTLFCQPIGHVQKDGDYRESFQPIEMKKEHYEEACRMADIITKKLTGYGIWGVEFFISNKDGVYFSELSPRPHDTGMVTLAGTQNLNEFELHLRAFLGLPIEEITLEKYGASSVVLSDIKDVEPEYSGVEEAMKLKNIDVRIFGKPVTRINRRMGVCLTYDKIGTDINILRDRVKKASSLIKVIEKK